MAGGDNVNGDREARIDDPEATTGHRSTQRADHRAVRDAVLITNAQQALDEQHRARVRRYLLLMAFRVPALVIAGIVFSATGNGWIALGIVALSIPLPWVAVLMANDRPARKRGEVPHYKYGADHEDSPRALDDGTNRALDHRIVDSTTTEAEHHAH